MKYWAVGMLIIGFLVGSWVLIWGGFVFDGYYPDPEKAAKIQPFVTGLVVPFLTLGSTLLVLENLRTSARQNFSNNFFKLIDQHHKLVDNISEWVDGFSSEDKPSKGRAFFDELAEKIACDYYFGDLEIKIGEDGKIINPSSYSCAPSKDLDFGDAQKEEKLNKIYDHHFQIYHSALGHYFRNLYHLVKYADESNMPQTVKDQHVKILRAQLSNYEILLLAYNGMQPYGEKFWNLIEKYSLIKNLNNETQLATTRNKRIIDLDVIIKAYPHLKDSEFGNYPQEDGGMINEVETKTS